VAYREWALPTASAVLWHVPAAPESRRTRVLPDGCIDLLFTCGELVVAGPDRTAHVVDDDAGYLGLRFAPGTAPALLGVPAQELCDQRVPLSSLWPRVRAERLTDEVITDPAGALARLAGQAAPDSLAVHVAGLLDAGWSIAATADAVGLSARQLHRRSLPAFGYGPKTLARVLRLQRAVRLVQHGRPPAEVAARTGYVDQPHLSREVRALTGAGLSALRP